MFRRADVCTRPPCPQIGNCSSCGIYFLELKFCARCRAAKYCSRECQVGVAQQRVRGIVVQPALLNGGGGTAWVQTVLLAAPCGAGAAMPGGSLT